MSLDVLLLIVRIAIAIALYVFLGALFGMLWRDATAAGQPERSSPIPEGNLEVIDAGETPLEPGKTYPLKRLTTLGRAPTSTIILPDGFASLDHARIVLRGDRWWLEDRDSRNGTLVNHIPVKEPIVLSTGDVITVGSVTLRVDLG
jgi:pSer/pThr/pTyr-binding forkhead associated (FHA) protein